MALQPLNMLTDVDAAPQQPVALNTLAIPAQPLAQPPTAADAYDATSSAYSTWVDQERQSGVAAGLLDPVTGWPTQNALVDAAHQYGSALMASTSAPTPTILGKFGRFDNVTETAAQQAGLGSSTKPVRRLSYQVGDNEVGYAEHSYQPDGTTYIRVAPEQRGNGYGPEILDHLASIGKTHGDPTTPQSVAMFERAGWTRNAAGRYEPPAKR